MEPRLYPCSGLWTTCAVSVKDLLSGKRMVKYDSHKQNSNTRMVSRCFVTVGTKHTGK